MIHRRESLWAVLYCCFSCRLGIFGWQHQQHQQHQSRRSFCVERVAVVGGLIVGTVVDGRGRGCVPDTVAVAVGVATQDTTTPVPPSTEARHLPSRPLADEDFSEWFQNKLQPATEERPAIPLPSTTPRDQNTQPSVQGVIYGPSTLPVLLGTRSSPSYLLVQVFKKEEDEIGRNMKPGSPSDASLLRTVQSAKIPLSQVSFPFQFQFTKLLESIPNNQDLLVRATLLLDIGAADDEVTGSSSSFCSYLTGEGVAKALLLPSSPRSSSRTSTSSIGIPQRQDSDNNDIYVRGPATVRLGPLGTDDATLQNICFTSTGV